HHAYRGRKFRATPNTVLFSLPVVHYDLFTYKANVKKSNFYNTWQRNNDDVENLNRSDGLHHSLFLHHPQFQC
ncbi:hypothetical protein K469DRAFT_578070, partial [Zopfia rhizophila CBS 207.26]